MENYNVIMATQEATVVASYEKSSVRSDAYQSEAQLESAFVKLLTEQGYEYLRSVTSSTALIHNLREQLENSAYTTEVETVEVPATKEVFEAYCSIVKNAYAMLIDFVKSIGSDKEYTRAVDKMLDAFDNELCDIM
ncbi:MAG: hypothetical protein IIZ62_08580 [Ruminococcus sp.]|nr:hypothetical protein [Ruminococcus sp.]